MNAKTVIEFKGNKKKIITQESTAYNFTSFVCSYYGA